MDRHSVGWHGVIPPIVTPFRADGAIDEAAFRDNIAFLIERGVHGIVVAGCTGEFWALTNAERAMLFRAAVDEAKGRIPVIAGTGAIATPDVIELTRAAKDAGADGAMVITPFFVTPRPDDIVTHYRRVSDAVALPILLYNIPRHAVNELTPALTDRIAAIEHVVGIKESSGDFNTTYRMFQTVGDRLHVFLGPIAKFGVAALSLGCSGGIEIIANFWPEGPLALYAAVRRGDLKEAHALQAKMYALLDLVLGSGRNMYASEKAVLNLLGLRGGFPRQPLNPVTPQDEAELRTGLERLGFPTVAAALPRTATR